MLPSRTVNVYIIYQSTMYDGRYPYYVSPNEPSAFTTFSRRKRLLKSSSWPTTSYLGHLSLFVAPQRMLLKLREDNSKFLPARSSLCYVWILRHIPLWLKPAPAPSPIDNRRKGLVSIRLRNILNTYVLYLLKTTILRFAIVRKSDRYTEFIMPAVLHIYFKSTINRSTLSSIIH